MDLSSDFLFVLCQRGAESALKRMLCRPALGLRSAYQRPGLVTFRSASTVTPATPLHTPLARAFGMSLGSVADLAAAQAVVARLPAPLRLHVVEPEAFRPGEAPPLHAPGALAQHGEQALRAAMPNSFLPGSAAREGELVLSVLVAAGDPIMLGLHVHGAGRSPWPGGGYPYELPPDAPSRAYGKIEEAIAAFQLPVRAGDRALELGAAPGGTAYALLRRGVHVIGVDPGAMAPQVLSFTGPGGAALSHLQISMNATRIEQLPEQLEWLLMDVHLPPQIALRGVRRFASAFRHSLLGAVLTLKLNDWSFVDSLPSFLQQARELGLCDPQARQLPAHRQELCIAGLTALGERRLAKL